ncbi:MAG TPA: hypothetical protein ENI34_09125 [candidate division WOR-3 bacterium]|uniref:Uncharacterized protein n=1 Tax=candidate division WOR-3 bacterium TaxID=2052148 RepID=A0A9C9EP68_UNCW3|nr:hypothetical protein [candidate division WOR-3 bacterium]
MKVATKILAILLVAALVIPGLTFAQKGKGEELKTGSEKLTVEKLKYKNIQDEIDPTYDFLGDIGEMIDNARHQKDGNDLLAAVSLLFCAEKMSGKKSSIITAAALLEEVGELAKEQKNAKLARAVADFYKDAIFGLGDNAKADEFMKLAKEYELVASQTRGYCWVRVNNYSSWTIDIYIDGWYKGTLSPGYYSYYKIWEGYTKLYGEGTYTDYFWGPIYRDIGEDETFTWNLWD